MNRNIPLVSILLPNLNTRPFLEERMATILNQTCSDWELIIADSYSDDGSWEYLNRFPVRDSRITACQIPRGLYQSWNFCLGNARGKYNNGDATTFEQQRYLFYPERVAMMHSGFCEQVLSASRNTV